MKDALVGYTGLVGSNLLQQHQFEGLYNSKNYQASYGTKPGVLIFAGVPGTLVKANSDPNQDFQYVETAIKTIRKIQPKRLILISTISVYPTFAGDESTPLKTNTAWGPYGDHRVWLEYEATKAIDDVFIVRPGVLFGSKLKKNFLFDILHPVPQFLKPETYQRLSRQSRIIEQNYSKTDSSLYQLTKGTHNLLNEFKRINWDSTKLTDSRSQFQFYPLKYMWEHIQIMIQENIRVLNLVSAPISAAAIYENYFHRPFVNLLNESPRCSNYTTIYPDKFYSQAPYCFDRQKILSMIINFLNDSQPE
jgi:hypothetical protein